jgi:hypothetical protein
MSCMWQWMCCGRKIDELRAQLSEMEKSRDEWKGRWSVANTDNILLEVSLREIAAKVKTIMAERR